MFLFNESNVGAPPENVIEGFRIGAKVNDNLNLLIPQGGVTNQYSARIVMDGSTSTSEKSFNVRRRSGINSIGANSDGNTPSVITLESAHNFINGETVRVIGETGQVPDGLEPVSYTHLTLPTTPYV